MRELVTLQVGSFANFIGSHFWNFQDELLGLASDPDSDPVFKTHQQYLNMDVLYRSGETLQGNLTYTPRLISIDYQGSLGSMSSRGTLYNEDSSSVPEVPTWTGCISTQVAEPCKKNLFLQSLSEEEQNDKEKEIRDEDIVENLENSVKYWTDFSKVHYHPQSIYELSGLFVDTAEFDNYGAGRDIFSKSLLREEISDRLRFFVEECDHIQGFQFIVDDSGSLSALAGDFLESIADEYTNTPVLLYNARGPGPYSNLKSRNQIISRNIHDAISFSRLSSFCKLIAPIGLPSLSKSKVCTFLCIEDEKPYHCSAVYAAGLHSICLPFRMEPLGPTSNSGYVSGAMDVNGLIQTLAGIGRQNKVAILDIAMPAPIMSGEQVEQFLLRSLQPLISETADDVEDSQAVESMTVHGAFGSGGEHASVSEVMNTVNAAYEHSLTRPLFCHLSTARCPLPIPLPFPSIFSSRVGKQGELLSSPIPSSQSRGSLDVHSIPMAARLRSSSAILPYLENRLVYLRRCGIENCALGTKLVRSWGFGTDELEDMEQTLSEMVATLNPGYQNSSDSD
ncbi:hypothetical protein K2173_018536 [Erythroxylum novogranatense]|uniref:Protein misato homolog 1 n=1 Tax=Erythroxylum novogranatense TaxID=1862640 RepID=A0AAV8UE55_9ROSI|nr:hypothetical protein K2173_018536 [Erythroxylum novogranatense]